MRSAFAIAAALAALSSCSRSTSEPPRFQVPAGFSVETAAPGSATGSLVALTFDHLGRPVVSKENEHPTILFDKDGDGIFETQKAFSRKVRNCQGMWFDGPKMYGVCDDMGINGQAALFTLEDVNGDDEADRFFIINGFKGRIQEHGPHDIRRGPDGLPTIMLGNHTGAPDYAIDPQSPLRGYRESQLLERYMDARGHAAGLMAPGGVLVRLDQPAPGERYTLIAGGFRNAYNHAYHRDGEVFTFDSDMEWDINMPWYREVRTVHVVPAGDYGWRTGSGKFPNYYLDSLPPVRELGRGSPVGVEFYQHTVYPDEYRDALIEGDWSRGRILATRLARRGATYAPESSTVKEFVHGEPLNVTDVEVGPDGFLYFTTGGRGTDGGLYRVRYSPSWWSRLFNRKPEGNLAAVRQPQPLSSWGHAALLKAKRDYGASWGADLEKLARDTSADANDRAQALFLMQRLDPKPSAELLRALLADDDTRVRSAAVYMIGLRPGADGQALAAIALKDTDAFVRRRAAEAAVRLGLSASNAFAPSSGVYNLLNDADRFVRYAGRVALERYSRQEWAARALAETNPLGAIEGMLALTRTAASESDLEPVFEKQIAWLKRADLSVDDRLRLLRAFHVAAAELKAGMSQERRRQVHEIVAPQFPNPDERLSRELARTLAYCSQPEGVFKLLAAIPRNSENQPLQIHYVYCVRAMKPPPPPYCVPNGRKGAKVELPSGCEKSAGWTPDNKQALVNWFAKAIEWRGGASFTGFLNLMFDTALEVFTEEEKQEAYRRIPSFAPPEKVEAARADRRGWKRPSVLARQRGVAAVSPQEIFEFQMFDPMTLKAKAPEGRKLFEDECASCHRFGGAGKDFGPDLTTLASRFKKKDILEAVLWPSKAVSDQYRSTIVETSDGGLIDGLIVKEDKSAVLIKTGESERPVELPVAKIKSRRKSEISIMPDGLLDGYSQDQISALIAFLLAGPK